MQTLQKPAETNVYSRPGMNDDRSLHLEHAVLRAKKRHRWDRFAQFEARASIGIYWCPGVRTSPIFGLVVSLKFVDASCQILKAKNT